MSRVLNLILSHQPRAQLEQLLAWWSSFTSLENILVAYGGTREEFEKLADIPRVFVSDPRLRMEKTRGRQSYGGVWRRIAQWLAEGHNDSFTHVYFAEFDHLPVVPDLAGRLVDRLEQEQADVLGHGLRRVDGTSNVLYLYHLSDPEFMKFWRRISVRPDKQIVLHMLATGSFWTRKAFTHVAAQREEIPVYLEIYLPTLAHHLGFRVKDFREQNKCAFTYPVAALSVERARQEGCWTIHPIKTSPSLIRA